MNKLIKINEVSNYLDIVYEKFPELFVNVVDYNRAIGNVTESIKKACEITKLSCEELLGGLDFDKKNISKEKTEAFIAELRAIFWLRNFGFTKITPIKQKKKQKSPDISVRFKNKKGVVEVFCLTATHGQGVNNEKFEKVLIEKMNNKKCQLDIEDAEIKILLCVVNVRRLKALSQRCDFERSISVAYDKLKWSNPYYIGICTGLEDDEFIYPNAYKMKNNLLTR